MSGCETARPAPLRCPSASEILDSILALLPRGRAWQSNEGGPPAPIEAGFNPAAFNNSAFSTTTRRGTWLYRFWKSVAGVFAFVEQRLCDLRLEFWCATHRETHDLWMQEFGLPDACDPFPDLCAKVAAIGGTRCDYYAEIAARAGWSVACSFESCGGPLLGRALLGRARVGSSLNAGQLRIIVNLPSSLSFVGTASELPRLGRFRLGRRLSCGPDITPFECLMARVVHAEIHIIYEVRHA